MADTINEMLRAIASGLKTPTVLILLLLLGLTVIMLGTLLAELFTERVNLKASIPNLVDRLQGRDKEEICEIIDSSELLQRQKDALKNLAQRGNLPENTQVALAEKLLFDEEKHYAKRVKITDFIAKVGPMFGLMGTLIPLAPGIIALGQGDVKTLSDSLMTAFDTTVAGLVCAALSLLISSIRKSWYSEYSSCLQALMDAVLDCNEEKKVSVNEKK